MPNVSITVEGRAISISAETFNAGSFNSSEKTCIGATLGCNTPEVCRWFMIWVSSDCRGEQIFLFWVTYFCQTFTPFSTSVDYELLC